MQEAKRAVNAPISDVKLTARQVKSFWEKVDKTGDCWLWTAGKNKQGYGRFGIYREGRSFRINAHRVSYFISIGNINNDLLVCHKCDNPTCVNPSHLFLGTHKDNAIDRVNKGRNNSPTGDNHGLRKHPEAACRGDDCWMRKYPERRIVGESAFGSKLKTAQIPEIRSLAKDGHTHLSIALKFGVTRQCIQKIVTRTHWKHIP